MRLLALTVLQPLSHLALAQSNAALTKLGPVDPQNTDPPSAAPSDYVTEATLISASPTSDPCGPASQPTPNPIGDTCNTSIALSNSPSPYGVQCLNNDPNTNISWTACAIETIPAICDQLTDPAVQKGKWIWASATPPDVCWLGFYLPTYAGSAQVPTLDRCVNEIFRPMVGFCNVWDNQGENNLGLVNVKSVPDGSQSGQAVDVGYPSFVLASRELTGGG
ncbi:hypothetical protein MMC28_001504 [Mycoblastus sanguinarius]|nr:hypothetical protein [Mycoblastus sanguinarius]